MAYAAINSLFEAHIRGALEAIAKGARGCRLCGAAPAFHFNTSQMDAASAITLRCPQADHASARMIPEGARGSEGIMVEARRVGLFLVDYWNEHHAIPLATGRIGDEVL